MLYAFAMIFLIPVVALELARVTAAKFMVAFSHATTERHIVKVTRMRDGCCDTVVLALQHKSAL